MIKKLLLLPLALLIFAQPLSAQYTAKVIKILTYSIVFAETWEEAYDLEALVGAQERTTVRRWYLKIRENDDENLAFDYNYESITPANFATNGGQGFGQDNTALPQKIFIRTRASNLTVELVYYQ